MEKPNLPDYEIIKYIGVGGFGRVWLAQENISKRRVAIKALKSESSEDQKEIIEEIELLAKFEHSNIVTYHHPIVQGDIIYFVMEYCAKGNLYENAEESSKELIISWIISSLHALESVHKEGIYHNDLKPANLLLSSNGLVKISDFGCANLFRGTTAFMPPEFLSGEFYSNKDPRRDIYSLGVTLLELLTGANPFYDLSREEIIQKHISGDIPMPGVPIWLQEVILKAIHRVPELRFQTAVDFAEALEAKHVPSVLSKKKLIAGLLSERISKLIKQKKWVKAQTLIEEGLRTYPQDVSILRASGLYYLDRQRISLALHCFQKALKFNPRIDVQKQLGLCQLESGHYPQAISLLNDHLSRSGLDLEAYNSLIRCYYETNRYEYAIQLADELLSSKQLKADCLINNRMICNIMMDEQDFLELSRSRNPFVQYHLGLLNEHEISFVKNGTPSLKSKLLFQDFRFNNLRDNSNSFWIRNKIGPNTQDLSAPIEIHKAIYRIGRTDYGNDMEFPTNMVSRRHAVIINQKNDVWLYDLASTGSMLNGFKVTRISPLIDRSTIEINKGFKMIFENDLEKLL